MQTPHRLGYLEIQKQGKPIIRADLVKNEFRITVSENTEYVVKMPENYYLETPFFVKIEDVKEILERYGVRGVLNEILAYIRNIAIDLETIISKCI